MREISERSRCALFLDFDGTISPIVARPDQARISAEMRDAIRGLIRHPRFSVSIVSGRTVEELKGLVALEGVILAGVHGLHISYPDGEYMNGEAARTRPALDRLMRGLEALLPIPGVIIEDKGLTVALHYRMVPQDDIPILKNSFKSILDRVPGGGSLSVVEGKMVYEVRPQVEWHKGRAVEQILEHLNRGGAVEHFPIYLGDDTTDEDAFAVLSGRGLAVRVGDEGIETAAAYYLNSVDETLRFIRSLAET